MKKQLVILSLLVGTLSLWGMEVDPQSKMKFMQALETPLLQQAAANTPEKKEALSSELFKRFHYNVFEYFKTDQTQEKKLEILMWINNWLPLINMAYKNEQEFNEIETFVNHPQEVSENSKAAKTFFALMYVIYLRNHSEQLCKVLSAYFHMNLVENKFYKGFLLVMLSYLEYLADSILSAPKIERAPDLKSWKDIIARTKNYVKNYRFLPKSKTLFLEHSRTIKYICTNVQNALQEIQQTKETENAPSVSITAPSSVDDESKEPAITEEPIEEPVSVLQSEKSTQFQGQPPATVSEAPQQTRGTEKTVETESNEANPELTMWQRFVNGMNWLLESLRSISGV